MKLLSPKTQDSRPIIDRVKESLFSVLYHYDLPDGKMVADLFCGVGSMGLEALSRGAAFVTFVEKDFQIAATLNDNIAKAGFTENSKVIRSNAFRIGAPVGKAKYDLIFVDPPYVLTQDTGAESILSELLVLLPEQMAVDGVVIVRTHKSAQLLEEYGQLETIERRNWSSMTVTILRQKANDK